ncbi:hypothetical protein [Reyranella sp.]|uniref:hypothetical protein n=1 Tax=Reyranella sp. TaxID=1929291 RepID=UPI0027300A5A|nr:hypothetical protein [Reyranella sp.]MDP2378388.1 hypothetical protein [Reyranella sp.]
MRYKMWTSSASIRIGELSGCTRRAARNSAPLLNFDNLLFNDGENARNDDGVASAHWVVLTENLVRASLSSVGYFPPHYADSDEAAQAF